VSVSFPPSGFRKTITYFERRANCGSSDAFKSYSTEIFILQMMIKNFLFYAFSTFVNEFVSEHGPGHMCRVFGIVTLCGFTTCIPMCK
jgi:hypothetical protein